ncbi:MAG TPA: hypothetical protein EYQ81_11400, partial [Sneathiellales bacterium]|nr:hypothetical protein [Sneathiellales bacterium]
SHFALVDIDPERLEYAGQIVSKICEQGPYPHASYSLHQDRATALVDADFVISSLLVGGVFQPNAGALHKSRGPI